MPEATPVASITASPYVYCVQVTRCWIFHLPNWAFLKMCTDCCDLIF